jgi:hypothetical protein
VIGIAVVATVVEALPFQEIDNLTLGATVLLLGYFGWGGG